MSDAKPCPICEHLHGWYGQKHIAEATHGAGGPDWEWHACYEHYKVLSAAQFIGLLRPPPHAKNAASGEGGGA